MQEETSRRTTKMERGEVSKVLPLEVVEKIVAMIPFPYIFKYKALSKSWLTRFSPISSLADEKDKLLATSFQNQVAKSSTKWPIFSPVCTTRKDHFGYNQASRKWQRLPSSLPLYGFDNRSRLQVEGALLYGFHDLKNCLEDLAVASIVPAEMVEIQLKEGDPLPPLPNALNSICVANLLTRKWKQLPPVPGQYDVNSLKLVNDSSLGTYKVIQVSQNYGPEEQNQFEEQDQFEDQLYIHIYDSESETWSSNMFSAPAPADPHSRATSLAYLNGILYMVYKVSYDNWAILLAFNVEEESLEEFKLFIDDGIGFDGEDVTLAVCNGNLVMITDDPSHLIRVLEIDLEMERLREVAQCETEDFEDIINSPISETNCIFYKMQDLHYELLLTHDQQKDAWSFFSFPETRYPMTQYPWSVVSTFRPSLNPFMAV